MGDWTSCLVPLLIQVAALQVWSSRCHDWKNGCICTKKFDNEGYESVVVHPDCSVCGHSDRVTSVEFSPDGKRFVSGSDDKFVKVWDTETGAVVSSLSGVRCVAEVSMR